MGHFMDLFHEQVEYQGAKAEKKFDDKADPIIQLEQAIDEAEEARNATHTAASKVVGNAKNIEMQLNQAGKDLAKAEQLVMAGITAADKKRVDGDTAGADAMDQATARQAATVTSLRTRVEDLKQSYQQAYDAAELAKQQDKDAEAMLQQAIQRRAELEGKAAQAKLLEATNTAMAQLHDTSGHIIPTMGEIEAKINTQYANAVGVQELDAANGMHDEQLITAANAELGAADVVAEMRAKMGQPAPAIEGTPAPEALPAAPAS